MISTILKGKGDCRYAILGTGVLGGYYGACLQRVGVEVHFLLHRNYKHVREQGLVIESPDGDFTVPYVNAYKFLDMQNRCFNGD